MTDCHGHVNLEPRVPVVKLAFDDVVPRLEIVALLHLRDESQAAIVFSDRQHPQVVNWLVRFPGKF